MNDGGRMNHGSQGGGNGMNAKLKTSPRRPGMKQKGRHY
jgi:hypothetical protein